MRSNTSERAPWLKDLIAIGYRMGIPMGTLLRHRGKTGAVTGVGTPGSAVQLHLGSGETITVEVDEANADYICGCLAAESGSAGFIWFETMDGCLCGLNLAHIDAVNWKSSGADAADPAWNRDCVSLRFSDGAPMELPKIAGETIEYLEGATIHRRRRPFHLLRYPDGRTVSVNLQNLVWVTMPGSWLDDAP